MNNEIEGQVAWLELAGKIGRVLGANAFKFLDFIKRLPPGAANFAKKNIGKVLDYVKKNPQALSAAGNFLSAIMAMSQGKEGEGAQYSQQGENVLTGGSTSEALEKQKQQEEKAKPFPWWWLAIGFGVISLILFIPRRKK